MMKIETITVHLVYTIVIFFETLSASPSSLNQKSSYRESESVKIISPSILDELPFTSYYKNKDEPIIEENIFYEEHIKTTRSNSIPSSPKTKSFNPVFEQKKVDFEETSSNRSDKKFNSYKIGSFNNSECSKETIQRNSNPNQKKVGSNGKVAIVLFSAQEDQEKNSHKKIIDFPDRKKNIQNLLSIPILNDQVEVNSVFQALYYCSSFMKLISSPIKEPDGLYKCFIRLAELITEKSESQSTRAFSKQPLLFNEEFQVNHHTAFLFKTLFDRFPKLKYQKSFTISLIKSILLDLVSLKGSLFPDLSSLPFEIPELMNVKCVKCNRFSRFSGMKEVMITVFPLNNDFESLINKEILLKEKFLNESCICSEDTRSNIAPKIEFLPKLLCIVLEDPEKRFHADPCQRPKVDIPENLSFHSTKEFLKLKSIIMKNRNGEHFTLFHENEKYYIIRHGDNKIWTIPCMKSFLEGRRDVLASFYEKE